MPKSTFGLLLLMLGLWLAMAQEAKAQFAVIDVGAIVQLVQQVQACSASRADARVWTAARDVMEGMRAISPKKVSWSPS